MNDVLNYHERMSEILQISSRTFWLTVMFLIEIAINFLMILTRCKFLWEA